VIAPIFLGGIAVGMWVAAGLFFAKGQRDRRWLAREGLRERKAAEEGMGGGGSHPQRGRGETRVSPDSLGGGHVGSFRSRSLDRPPLRLLKDGAERLSLDLLQDVAKKVRP
jgi:hypothetical protein